MLGETVPGPEAGERGEATPRFSIVIPAHNEESYLPATLEHVATLNYPRDGYEVIVVENGSTDRTLEVARRFEGGNVRVVVSQKTGVSAAKNHGIDQLSPHSQWVIFLDADTLLKPGFLNDLQAKVDSARRPLAIGTTTVTPLDGDLKARAWFAYYDFSHRFGGSYAIQIAKRSLFPALRFDEDLRMGEDALLIRKARKQGRFFYLSTRTVHTSTRRFDTAGYWRIFFRYWYFSLLPVRFWKAFDYKVIR
ncbi:glycosyltransferase [Mycobacterium sp. PS03-16]|uniref:glycosyltransferase family 2 protein n=1 Tax=Mycobacterium sp. PS03-16 TaxID=2559611 RepID=UPI001FD7CA0E|nr:glycosyltransferase [Mycobacterium sp. PS03-16]